MTFTRIIACTTLFLMAGLSAVKAQRLLPSAYLITSSSDTLRGELLHEGISKRTYQIQFKPEGGQLKSYAVAEIKGYGLGDSLQYEAHEVLVNEQRHRLLLQVLVEGPVKLYYAKDFITSYEYFLQKPQEALVPLHKSYFTGTLSALLKECGTVNVERHKYGNNSLANLVNTYNNCQYAGQESRILHAQAKTQVKWGLRIIGQSSQLVFPFEDRPPQNHTFEWESGVTAGIFLNFSLPRKAFSVQPELIYTSRKVSSTYRLTAPQAMDYDSDLNLMAQYLQLPVLLKYSLSRSEWHPYLNAGVSYGLALSRELNHTITYESGHIEDLNPKMDRYTLGFVLGGGMQFRHFSVDARFNRDIANSNELDNRLYFNTVQLGLGYTF